MQWKKKFNLKIILQIGGLSKCQKINQNIWLKEETTSMR